MIEDVVHRNQVKHVSEGLGYPQNQVKKVIDSYTGYLKYLMERRYECSFLGIVVFRNSKMSHMTERETYAYQVRTVADEVNIPYVQAKAILDYLRDMVRTDVKRGIAYPILRLVKIDVSPDMRLNLKSSKTVPTGIRVRATNRFRSEVNVEVAA